MKIQLAVLSAAIACCAANKPVDLSADIPAKSKLGTDLLSKARRVNQNEEEQYTWINDYSIKFNSCHTLHLFGGEGEEEQEEGSNPVGNQHLVNFKLCPSADTNCKNGGEYVVKMRDFLEVYLETKAELEASQCEAVEENCNCNYYDGDDDSCLAKCYQDAGLDYCVEEEFNAAEYLECAEAEFSNNAYYASTYFIGPICSDSGKSVNMGIFKDMTCSVAASTSTYKTYNNGYSLPYADKSMVDSDSISCKEVDENEYYQNNYYDQAEPIELCQQLYMQSAKCENRMKYKSDQDVGSCTYINKVIPALEKVYEKQGGNGKSATVLAWVFFATTLIASAGFYHFFTIAKRKNIDLSGTNASSGGII